MATPMGTSALAVVRASGPQVVELTKDIFGAVPPPRTVQRSDYRDSRGQLVDDVLYTSFSAPNSYTGEDVLEISCHGNPYIAQRILEDLVQRGCRPAEAGEFTKRAFLGGRLDLSQAEAVMDLIHARSERALAAANQQLRGSLGRSMKALIDRLVAVLAGVEAYIDFPDEDLPPEDRETVLRELKELKADVDRLLATSHYGDLLRDGIRTVIIGEPNAGKSSLLNRLVGRDRALVSPEPGTTRDYLEEAIVLGPHLLRLVDTAGLNSNPSALESLGIEKALEQAGSADLFLWVIDSTLAQPQLPSSLAGLLSAANTLAVFNKCDLPHPRRETLRGGFRRLDVSALTGAGFDELRSAIVELGESFRTETGDEVIAINARHALALERASSSLESARAKVVDKEPIELIASDMREALDALGEISGKVDNESVLDGLFASFCIGK
jgi:tRNA modification GTPase